MRIQLAITAAAAGMMLLQQLKERVCSCKVAVGPGILSVHVFASGAALRVALLPLTP